jgi:hypothetical protein
MRRSILVRPTELLASSLMFTDGMVVTNRCSSEYIDRDRAWVDLEDKVSLIFEVALSRGHDSDDMSITNLGQQCHPSYSSG